MPSKLRLACALLFAQTIAIGAVQAEPFRLVEIDQNFVKWEPRGHGENAVVVTYRFVEKVRRFPDARNCGAIKPMQLRSNRSPIPLKQVVREFEKAAQKWSDVAAIRFAPSEKGDDADLLIGAQLVPRGRAFTNLVPEPGDRSVEQALNGKFESQTGPQRSAAGRDFSRLRRSVICLNSALPWKIGFDGDLEVYDLRYTFIHELGHVLGLNHSRSPKSVMDFRYRETHTELQPDDISGAIFLYGAAIPE